MWKAERRHRACCFKARKSNTSYMKILLFIIEKLMLKNTRTHTYTSTHSKYIAYCFYVLAGTSTIPSKFIGLKLLDKPFLHALVPGPINSPK